MGSYTILKNSSIDIYLVDDYQDNGWSFLNGMAIHDPYNEGSFINKIFRPEGGKEYTIKIQVSGLNSGFLEVEFGGVLFGRLTTSGFYTLTAETINNSFLKFTAGRNSVNIVSLEITEGLNDGTTIVYDTLNKGYVGELSIKGDMMERFLEDFIVFKNGQPWLSDKSEQRNNFFGIQYPSVIRFWCNVEFDKDKDFYSITLNGNKPWLVTCTTPPSPGKTKGQRSRIKPLNFTYDKGKYIANFLRDMNDPRYEDELQALMKGAHLQGKLMEVTLTHNGSDSVELLNVEVDVSVK